LSICGETAWSGECLNAVRRWLAWPMFCELCVV